MIVGVEKNGFTASLFSYNGMNESDDPTDDDNDTINGFGAALAYSYEQEDRGFNAGIAWATISAMYDHRLSGRTKRRPHDRRRGVPIADQVRPRPPFWWQLQGLFPGHRIRHCPDSFAATEALWRQRCRALP